MAKKVYKDIHVTQEVLDCYLPLDDLIEWLKQFRDWKDCYVMIPRDEFGDTLTVEGLRKETDDERDKRLAAARKKRKDNARKREEKEEKERDILRDLMKKYPDEIVEL